MIDIDEFHELLNEVCDELPEDFFRELHQGVILEAGVKISPHAKSDDLIPYADRECIRDKLREVVRHEFRHHMENLGGMYGRDSLEYEDKVSLHEYLAQHD